MTGTKKIKFREKWYSPPLDTGRKYNEQHNVIITGKVQGQPSCQ